MHMDGDAVESPATFLDELRKSLNSDEAMDTDLAKIISQHILIAVPVEDCVEQAMKAMTELAETRVTSRKENLDG